MLFFVVMYQFMLNIKSSLLRIFGILAWNVAWGSFNLSLILKPVSLTTHSHSADKSLALQAKSLPKEATLTYLPLHPLGIQGITSSVTNNNNKGSNNNNCFNNPSHGVRRDALLDSRMTPVCRGRRRGEGKCGNNHSHAGAMTMTSPACQQQEKVK